MEFNYVHYINSNPLLKEYVSDEEYDTMNDDELDAAEKSGDLASSDRPLGPDEETFEEGSKYPRAEFADAVAAANQAGISKEELHILVNQNAK